MLNWIEREAVYLWYYLDIQIRQIAPYWALGIVLGSVVSVFGKKAIHGAFAKIGRRRTGWLGVIPASLLGIASPLCMYGTIPIAASFSEQGVKYIAESAADFLQWCTGKGCGCDPICQLFSVRLCRRLDDSSVLYQEKQTIF